MGFRAFRSFRKAASDLCCPKASKTSFLSTMFLHHDETTLFFHPQDPLLLDWGVPGMLHRTDKVDMVFKIVGLQCL